ncbi:NADH-quinone oxidoreductase subunit J [Basilea psittacipulmonis]|uniref:NADH-quinone oxidoreductase subunit J n=1 Tax=Basilea psittacipulmonis DSM 24701 TaxID=1072685 RepID=A0A077DEC7_9BURK|nr:NADH-quinone oxidoreductase subunit J [Basilea psittacipulmonis]AIL33195.1 hypothetical protein IX83_07720 [Basilea psittacipulmonis DSM 24701]
MTFTDFLFYVFSLILIVAGLRVITARSPIVAVLHLILTFFTASMLWMLLGAEFLSLLLIVVYVGAVMVLFLFVIMMIDTVPEQLRAGIKAYLPLGILVAVVMVSELGFVLASSFTDGSSIVLPEGYNSTLEVGKLMYQEYTYAIQIGALILFVGMIAAISLTLQKRHNPKYVLVGEQLKVRAKDRLTVVSMPAEVETKAEAETTEATEEKGVQS